MILLRLLIATIALAVAGVANAAPASPESVARLLEVTRVRQQLEVMRTQSLPRMLDAVRQSLAGRPDGEVVEKAFDRMQPRFLAIMNEALDWDTMRPQYVAMYVDTFSQEEVDGLIAFYQSPLGTALLDKMPLLIQRSMQLAQQRMLPLLQKIEEMAKEEATTSGGKP